MSRELNSSQKAKMSLLILVVATAFYFNFRSKKELFFSSEYLYERMLRTQKATHFKSQKDITDYQQNYKKLTEDFSNLIPQILASPISEKIWSESDRELIKSALTLQYDWSSDVFSAFRKDWKGTETLMGHYKHFEIKNFDEHRSEGNVFVQYISMTNKSGHSFYGLNSYVQNVGPIILSEVVDITENLSWRRIGWPLSARSILWFTYLGQRSDLHKGYRVSLDRVGIDKMTIQGLEVLVDIKKDKPVKLDIIKGEFF